LPLLDNEEETALILQWNQTEADYSHDACLHQIFEQRASATPNAIAVRYGDVALSYGELNERANQLAHYIAQKGVAEETYVAIYLEPTPEMLIAILAIHKAGGAYVPWLREPLWRGSA